MIIFFFLLFFDFNEAGGPSSAYLANSSSITSFDATAFNPAVLPRIGFHSLALVHTNPYKISSLTYNRIVLNWNRPAFGFSFSSFGQTGYRENILSLASAFALNNNFSYGFIFKGYYLQINDYGSDFFPSLNLGVLYSQYNYRLAAVVEDLNNPKNRTGDLIPVSLRIGGTLIPNHSLSISIDLLKTVDFERCFAGIEFNLLPIFSLRTGIATNPYFIASGFGFLYKHLSFDYTYRFHPKLKETGVFSLTIKS